MENFLLENCLRVNSCSENKMDEAQQVIIKFLRENGLKIIPETTPDGVFLSLEATIEGKNEILGTVLPPRLGRTITLPNAEKIPGVGVIRSYLADLYKMSGGDYQSPIFDPFRKFIEESR